MLSPAAAEESSKPAPVTVISQGYPGRNTKAALRLLQKDVLPLHPDHVVVFLGMNDAMNSAALIPLDQYVNNLGGIVDKLKANGAKTVALVTLHPVIVEYLRQRHPEHPHVTDLQAHLASYNAAVEELAREKSLPLVDFRALVEARGGAVIAEDSLIRCEKNGGGTDGVHLTPAGYQLLGETVFATIGDRVAPGETVVCFGDSLTYGVRVEGAGTVTGETYPAVLQRCFDQRP
ncbi:MAG: GDSL-type esterase/lipase family protein [Verrucomicrobiota bacterium JB024]|nr:GDSL-type esterase/lipase family protein [Verrucomicrobiota bacterium JB024]